MLSLHADQYAGHSTHGLRGWRINSRCRDSVSVRLELLLRHPRGAHALPCCMVMNMSPSKNNWCRLIDL